MSLNSFENTGLSKVSIQFSPSFKQGTESIPIIENCCYHNNISDFLSMHDVSLSLVKFSHNYDI